MSMKMSCEDFYESETTTNDWYARFDECYWEGGPRSKDYERWNELVLTAAKEQGIELTDLDTFCYEDYFYNAYQCTEKGLS